MEEWDAQKMLDLYIHDYLVRKNMHTTADILAKEADIHPKSVVINPPEGFLSEWWSLFWDLYSSRLPNNNPQGDQATTSQAPLVPNDGYVLQNDMPFPPMPDANFMLQNMYPPTPRPGIPNMLQPINPTGMPRPLDMGNFLQSGFPPMMPKMDYGSNQFVQTPISISDSNLRQEQIMADFVSQRAREQEHLRLPPRNFDAVNANVLNAVNPNVLNAVNPNVLNADQFSSMLPVAGSSSCRQKKASGKRQLPVTNDVNYGPAFRRSVTSELTPHVPKLLQDDMSHVPDAGSSASSNSACPDASS